MTVEETPFIAETPMDAFAEPRTPTSLFFVRNHFDLPRANEDAWRLGVDGLVERPLTLSLPALRSRPARTVSVTLECAGNGRTAMVPPPPGTPWRFGGAGTADFTGVSLRSVLDEARLRPEAKEILFVGADRGEVEPGREEAIARSLPTAVALQDDVLLAWAMNGEPLAPAHGFPLRLVVPAWYGVASVKWLVQITALARPFEGYFQKERYVYVGETGTPHRTPVTRMRVRAIIGRPADGAVVPAGPLEVAGTAWSGFGPISLVDLSVDSGRVWSQTELGEPLSEHAATPWRIRWTPPRPGRYELVARATDDAGNTQPLTSLRNDYGYGNNVVHRVRVTVVRLTKRSRGDAIRARARLTPRPTPPP